MEAIIYGFMLRIGQVAIEASLTLVIGVVVAGILRRMVGAAGTRKLFGRGWKGLFRGWLAGMLLPVCSLGVIPVAREMRRAGVPGGTVLAFVLAAPLLNPISFLYGLTLAEPHVILTFAAFSLVLSTLAGWMWDGVFARDVETADAHARALLADAEPAPEEGPRRILAVFVTAAKELASRDLIFYAVGIAGSALLAAMIPFASLQATMKGSDWISPLLMTAIAVPIYASPLSGMMKIGLMFDHGNSIGAAFVLFALGIGSCLGTLAWLFTDFGWKRVWKWFLAYVAVIVALGYISQPLLKDPRTVEMEHSHAFDDYSAPFPYGSSDWQSVQLNLEEKFGPLERPSVYAFLTLLFTGFALQWFDRRNAVERWLTAPSTQSKSSKPKWDVKIPGPVLGGIAILGLIAFSIIGAYVYYPDREQCLDAMQFVYVDAVTSVNTSKSRDEAIRDLERFDLITRKLQVGEYLRKLKLTEEQSKAPEELREAMEEVRDALLANDRDKAKENLAAVEKHYKEVKAAFPRAKRQ
jgi:uncharacterized protein